MRILTQILIVFIILFTCNSSAQAEEPVAKFEVEQGAKSLRVSVTQQQAVFRYTVIYKFKGKPKTAKGVVDYGRMEALAEEMRVIFLESMPKAPE